MVFITACKQKETESHSHEIAEGKEIYTCPMHPQIIRDKPQIHLVTLKRITIPNCRLYKELKLYEDKVLYNTDLNLAG